MTTYKPNNRERRRDNLAFADLSPGRERSRLTVAMDKQAEPAGAVTISVSGARVRLAFRVGERFGRTARVCVREVAARIPTVILLEELAERAHDPELGLPMLADALLDRGHACGKLAAEIPGLLAVSRRGAQTNT
jgi:hypothetical protein